ncbi:MAG: SPFH domain-containing protein [Polyangiaceae bacterium]
MGDDRGRERDLVLAPNEFAFISDETKGNINVYVGPHKTSLANTDRPVVFDGRTKRFLRCSLEEAIQTFAVAPEGWYLTLKNPARDGSHPRTGALNNLPELDVGRKVNIPGPISFAQWPGQMCRVLQGHHLRSNQYLVVRVYDEEAAKTNWAKAVIKRQQSGAEEPSTSSDDLPLRPEDLTMGKLLVVRGTDVAFYIPPTGIEVVRAENNAYVRDAVTLERLEYCILLDENGNKRFIRGPAVVLPRPSETFVERDGATKFRAIELSETSGIYIKVIAPYEENGATFNVGDELFLTGKDGMIYFPRPEHAIIKYGTREIHYAIAIPAGEARYVLDRQSGQIRLHRGPSIFLPDPRHEVIVRRILDSKQVSLWFPGNQEALAHNALLRSNAKGEADFVASHDLAQHKRGPAAEAAPAPKPSDKFAGDDFSRNQSYTQPRTITLDTRYDGAVSISVWTGYAVLVVAKSGLRRVIVGPDTYLLEYDETLQSIELSTGVPKSEDSLLRTVYLRVLHNKVSDQVEAETRDLCRVHLTLSYRVNFEGESARWFDVENYVKFLTDHLRSLIRAAVKQHGIEQFYGDAAAIVRNVVLGLQEDGKRLGRHFPENGMHVYDVEVLDVTIGDEAIASLLVTAQQDVVRQTLAVAAEQRRVTFTRESEKAKQEIAQLAFETRARDLDLKGKDLEKSQALRVAEHDAASDLSRRQLEERVTEQRALGAVHDAELERRRKSADLDNRVEQQALEQRLAQLTAEVKAVVDKAGAVTPELIAALQSFGDKALIERVSESMAPLAILGGGSVIEVLSKLLRGTALGDKLGERALEAPKE